MACEMAWIVDRRVLYVRCIGPVNPAAMTRMNPDLMQFLAEGKAPVHIVHDTRLAGVCATPGQLPYPEAAALRGGSPLGWVLTVAGDPTQVFPTGMGADEQRRIFKDCESALAFLRHIDPTLAERLPG